MLFFNRERSAFDGAAEKMCFLLIEKDVVFWGDAKSRCFDGRASGRP